MATKKTPSTAVVAWEEELAAEAAVQASAEKPQGASARIDLKNGVLTYGGAPIPGNEFRCIIVADMYENQYYDQPYTPNTPAIPACYAFSDPADKSPDAQDAMEPHAEAENPQSEGCVNCEHNKFGTADGGNGKGKACGNIRQLLVLSEDALESADALSNAELVKVKVSVTSTKNYSRYIREVLGNLKRPSWSLITTVGYDAASRQYTFSFADNIDFSTSPELITVLKARKVEAEKALPTPYFKIEQMPAPTPAARGKAAAKAAPARGPSAGQKIVPAAKKTGGGKTKF
jgi:hypothetical protein